MAARGAIQSVIRWLDAAGLAGEVRYAVEIALAEAVNNVVKHGYDTTQIGRIGLTCRLGAGQLRIELCDNGPGLPDGMLPAGRPIDLAVPRQALPEGGFGWLLIRQLVRAVEYDRREGRNVLSLHFHVFVDAALARADVAKMP